MLFSLHNRGRLGTARQNLRNTAGCFGFHAALAPDQAGKLIIDSNATRLMYDMYPKPIRDWLNFNGGLAKRMIYLGGADLKKLYRECR